MKLYWHAAVRIIENPLYLKSSSGKFRKEAELENLFGCKVGDVPTGHATSQHVLKLVRMIAIRKKVC